MGRASRKEVASTEPRGHWSDTHPDRHLWTEAQRVHARMQTQAEYEALYGRGPAVEPQQSRRAALSKLFPNSPEGIISKLGLEPISGAERTELLASMRVGDGAVPGDDPVIQLLWKSELMRVQEEIEAFRQLGIEHWAADVDLEALEKKWTENVIGRLAQPPRTVLRRQADRWWTDDSDGREVLQRHSASLLQAAIYEGLVNREDLADNLERLSGMPFHNEYFAENIVWDPAWRKAYSSSSRDLEEKIWRALCEYCGRPSYDIGADYETLAQALPGKTATAFRADPLGDGSSPYGRAIGLLDWKRIQEGQGDAEAARVSQEILAAEIINIADGGAISSRQKWSVFHQCLDRNSDQYLFPLQNLRPLFVEAGQERLFNRMHDDILEKAKADPLHFAGDPLRDALVAHFRPGPDLRDIVGAVEESFRREFL